MSRFEKTLVVTAFLVLMWPLEQFTKDVHVIAESLKTIAATLSHGG